MELIRCVADISLRGVLDFNPMRYVFLLVFIAMSVRYYGFSLTVQNSTIASHLAYWADEDVAHFLMSQCLARHRSEQQGRLRANR